MEATISEKWRVVNGKFLGVGGVGDGARCVNWLGKENKEAGGGFGRKYSLITY